ncbi:hypothetical protein NC653_010018 [Populus alba x Populus x berolinensis]|uniref:Uncharacterized protein n=1 Tax=Populus alba x Populus x berolinensis TaxID=444605 RepID=A0AAD6RAN5_9ROSI|nr:hypothetical protein NC653_010018 [Populus alba x Populus x berolinensis]
MPVVVEEFEAKVDMKDPRGLLLERWALGSCTCLIDSVATLHAEINQKNLQNIEFGLLEIQILTTTRLQFFAKSKAVIGDNNISRFEY